MENLELQQILSFLISTLIIVLKFVWDCIKKKINEKLRVRVEEIAVVVEALYDNEKSIDKLNAFIDIARKRGLNVKKAVSYLEKNIIPISKQINSYVLIKNEQKEINKGVTN